MSNPNQQQHQQNQPQQPKRYVPDADTFVLLPCDEGVASRCRKWMQMNWAGAPIKTGRVDIQLDPRRLKSEHKIVVVYEDRDGLIDDDSYPTGKRMRRTKAFKDLPAEDAPIVVSQPVQVKDCYDGGDDLAGVQLVNVENRKGLFTRLVESCVVTDAAGNKRVVLGLRINYDKKGNPLVSLTACS